MDRIASRRSAETGTPRRAAAEVIAASSAGSILKIRLLDSLSERMVLSRLMSGE
jgi:hypothetical protein